MDEMVKCPVCKVRFTITWSVGYDRPCYCPFCGAEIDYELAGEK